MKRWLILDTETTGLIVPGQEDLKKQPQIIELAIIEVVVGGMSDGGVTTPPHIFREMSWLINPGCSLPPEIIKITGLHDEDLKGAPSFADLKQMLINDWFFGAWGMVAHNLPFDRGMLINELRRLNSEYQFPWPPAQLCTVATFEHIAGRRMRLIELYARVMGREYAQTHRALDDTRALAEVVLKERVLE